VHYGGRGGSSLIRSQATSYTISILIFGVLMPGIDNYAHIGGFAGGYLASAWLDPLKPGRINHMIAALACLLATALAILASVFVTLY
jgi:rhomboid protease GluP